MPTKMIPAFKMTKNITNDNIFIIIISYQGYYSFKIKKSNVNITNKLNGKKKQIYV